MSKTVTLFPEITTDPEFKNRVEHACKASHLTYADVVTRLLNQWLNGMIDLENEPDPDFVINAREALRSENVRNAMKRLGEQFDARRTYPNAIKIA